MMPPPKNPQVVKASAQAAAQKRAAAAAAAKRKAAAAAAARARANALAKRGKGNQSSGNPFHRPPAKPQTAGGKPPPVTRVPKPPALSDDAWATQQATKQIDLEVSSIEAERQAYLDELDAQSQQELDRGKGFAELLQSYDMPGRIQDIYGNASHDIAGLAGGFSTAMQGIASSQAAEQSNMLGGTGQEGAVRNEGVGMGDVLFGSQGYSPARGMAETGAAYASDAAMQPAFAMQLAQQAAAQMRTEGVKNMSDFALQIAKVRATKLGLKTEALELKAELKARATKERLDKAKFAFDRLKEERDWYYLQYRIANSEGDNKRAAAMLKQSQLRERRMSLAAKGLAYDGQLLPGFKLDKQGLPQKIKTPRASSTSSTVPGTPAFNASALKAVGKAQKDIVPAAQALVKQHGQAGHKQWNWPSFQEAVNALMKQFSYLATTGPARAALATAIRRILKAQGITGKGSDNKTKTPPWAKEAESTDPFK